VQGTIEDREVSMSLLQISYLLNDYLDPISAGILSVLIRMLPYKDYSSVESELVSGISKEMSAAIGTYHPVQLDYSPILSDDKDDRWTRAHHHLTLDPTLHNKLHRSIMKQALSLRFDPIYPRLSSKTPGRRVQRNAAPFLDAGPATYVDLERIYFRTGIKVDGETECRIAWKYNDLKPRVYYAMGARAFYASRYIQHIFNRLVNFSSVTHIFQRFSPETMDSNHEDSAFIYDYASFTSTLHEIRNFTRALADAFRDITVQLVDAREGLVDISLGDLLDSYNEECNLSPDFDVSELYDVTEAILTHNCGMLGVPGNITSCTMLHGIHLILLLGGENCGKVVGDDAIGRAMIAASGITRERFCGWLQSIGRISVDKMEFWEYRDISATSINSSWTYVKRPIDRIEDRMVFGHMLDFPSLANALNFRDQYHVYKPLTKQERIKIYRGQLQRFYRTISTLPSLSERGISLSDTIINFLHKRLEVSYYGVPKEFPHLFVPPAFYTPDYFDIMLSQRMDQTFYLPVEYSPDESEPCYRRGQMWIGVNSPGASYLEKLGLISREQLRRPVVVRDEEREIERFIFRKHTFRCLYQFVVLETIPEHLRFTLHVPLPITPEVTSEPSFVEYREVLRGIWSDSDSDSE